MVQGQKVEGNSGEERYREHGILSGCITLTGYLELRIHEETERGDNESIKMSRKDMGSLAGLKRGSGN